jgi:hypothetical protein
MSNCLKERARSPDEKHNHHGSLGISETKVRHHIWVQSLVCLVEAQHAVCAPTKPKPRRFLKSHHHFCCGVYGRDELSRQFISYRANVNITCMGNKFIPKMSIFPLWPPSTISPYYNHYAFSIALIRARRNCRIHHLIKLYKLWVTRLGIR